MINLVELSFSLSELWAKNLKGGAEHPPGQDRVKQELALLMLFMGFSNTTYLLWVSLTLCELGFLLT